MFKFSPIFEALQQLVEAAAPASLKTFEQSASSPEEFEQTIANFKQLVKAKVILGKQAKISTWVHYDWNVFRSVVLTYEHNIEQARQSGDEIVLETDHVLVVIPTDSTARCFAGSKVAWCQAPNDMYMSKASTMVDHGQNMVLVLKIGTSEYGIIRKLPNDGFSCIWRSGDSSTFSPESDATCAQLIGQTVEHLMTSLGDKLTPSKYTHNHYRDRERQVYSGDAAIKTDEFKQQMVDNREYALMLTYAQIVMRKPWVEIEPLVLEAARERKCGLVNIIEYGRQFYSNTGWPEFDQVFLDLAQSAVNIGYEMMTWVVAITQSGLANQPISDALSKAVLATVALENLNPSNGIDFSATAAADRIRTRVMNGKWPEFEKLARTILASNPTSKRAAHNYHAIFGVTDDEVLKQVVKSPKAAWEYAMQQNAPSPDLEDQILKTNFNMICKYVDRFYPNVGTPKINQIMIKTPQIALRYAILGLNDRFPEGESIIRTNMKVALQYAQGVLRGSWDKKAGDKFTDDAILKSGFRTLYQGWLNQVEPDRLDAGTRMLRWIKSISSLMTHKIRSSRVERDGDIQYYYYLTPGTTRVPGANAQQIEQHVLDELGKSTYKPPGTYYRVLTQYGANNSNTNEYTRIDLIVEYNSTTYSY